MSDTIATYSFLPWLRQGLSNNILTGDNDASVKLRASIPVSLKLKPTGTDGKEMPLETISKNIQLYGPGDIVGIDAKSIIKTEPRNWITNFEPNYLPYIDFYEEDFPWRYTPAHPNGERLRPWITLVVLKESEFEDGKNIKDRPLPFFKLKGVSAADVFPKPSELWAWAHVHINSDLSKGAAPNAANADSVTTEMGKIITQDPDNAYSRILCPRKLETNVGYYAFLIPTFESGRLAGLGLDLPIDLGATQAAWQNAANVEFPYYHKWYFHTGSIGDFEYLVNLLQPKPADKKVGVRDIDVLHPGSNLPAIQLPSNIEGVLKLGGALRVPFDTLKDEDKAEVTKYDQWDEDPALQPHPFVSAMAKRVNLADDYSKGGKTVSEANLAANLVSQFDESLGDEDPIVTSPLYGRWHALQERLLYAQDGVSNLPNNKNWIHEINLDPRFRVAAGLGTKVLQKGQEEYMQAAWEQVGKIVEANHKIRLAQMAKEVSAKYYEKHILPLGLEKSIPLTAPLQKRIIFNGFTVHKTVIDSVVPRAMTQAAFRQQTRPRGGVAKRLETGAKAPLLSIVERVNEGHVTIVPPRVDPKGAINLTDIVIDAQPKGVPQILIPILKKYQWIKFLPFILVLIAAVIILVFFRNAVGFSILGTIAAGCSALYYLLDKWGKAVRNVDYVKQEMQTSAQVSKLSKYSNFVISRPEDKFKPQRSQRDSEEAIRFKSALKDVYSIVEVPFSEPSRMKLDLVGMEKKIKDAIDPKVVIPKRALDGIKIPERILNNMVEKFTPVMVYPEIDVPMYKPLSALSSELFLPNINLIEQNSITLLENNQKFIESYMVGINHEMSRELLWREYPTDQRGTYFRQFWDVSSFLPPQPVPADLKESLRDIPPIHKWFKTSSTTQPHRNELGQHNLRAISSGKTQLVLVVRGELLKKYPTAVVYAHKADWGPETGTKNVNEERVFVKLTTEEEKNPPTNKIKTPLFEAKVDPDIYFFGFDLDDEEARGVLDPTNTSQDPGWFFVIKERPGEPRFGLDIEKNKVGNAERLINWNNLSWKDINVPDGKCIELDLGASSLDIKFNTYDASIDQENKVNIDDQQAHWNKDTNAAELAYILYQVPVLVGVHASRMLPK